MESHLLQMRGLKLYTRSHGIDLTPSHLLQMRGLKLEPWQYSPKKWVASFTDAWIETSTWK